jgi:hypothetical protein
MRDDNYPDNIRDFDDDPRSPFYDNSDEEWKADKAEELVDEFNRLLKLDDWFEAAGQGYDAKTIRDEAIEGQVCFDKRLYEIAEKESERLFEALRWDDRGNEQ